MHVIINSATTTSSYGNTSIIAEAVSNLQQELSMPLVEVNCRKFRKKHITQHGVRDSSPRDHFINMKQPRPKNIQVTQHRTKNEPLIRDGANLASGESRAENTTYLPNLVNEKMS
jgi:hypothetical protein